MLRDYFIWRHRWLLYETHPEKKKRTRIRSNRRISLIPYSLILYFLIIFCHNYSHSKSGIVAWPLFSQILYLRILILIDFLKQFFVFIWAYVRFHLIVTSSRGKELIPIFFIFSNLFYVSSLKVFVTYFGFMVWWNFSNDLDKLKPKIFRIYEKTFYQCGKTHTLVYIVDSSELLVYKHCYSLLIMEASGNHNE